MMIYYFILICNGGGTAALKVPMNMSTECKAAIVEVNKTSLNCKAFCIEGRKE